MRQFFNHSKGYFGQKSKEHDQTINKNVVFVANVVVLLVSVACVVLNTVVFAVSKVVKVLCVVLKVVVVA